MWTGMTFQDARDGTSYRTMQSPDGLWWLAENFRYRAAGSMDPFEGNPADHGLVYLLDAARKVVPNGWRLPSPEEWQRLSNARPPAEFFGPKVHIRTPDGVYNYSETITTYWSSKDGRTGMFGLSGERTNHLAHCTGTGFFIGEDLVRNDHMPVRYVRRKLAAGKVNLNSAPASGSLPSGCTTSRSPSIASASRREM